MHLLAIDPGTTNSAYSVLTDRYEIVSSADTENDAVLKLVIDGEYDDLVIEGMQPRLLNMQSTATKSARPQMIGSETYETCIWIGRFIQAAKHRGKPVHMVYRSEERSAIIPSKKNRLPPLPASTGKSIDSQIRAGLIARFAKHDKRNGKGTAKNRDTFYGFQGDMWASFAVGVTWLDKQRGGVQPRKKR